MLPDNETQAEGRVFHKSRASGGGKGKDRIRTVLIVNHNELKDGGFSHQKYSHYRKTNNLIPHDCKWKNTQILT